MPRIAVDIEKFNSGIMSSPDPEDIPIDAASYSRDIDGSLEPGNLRQRNGDLLVFEGTLTQAGYNETIVEDDGKRTLVYYDGISAIKASEDVFGTNTISTLKDAFPNGLVPAMERHNREIHIGLGNGSLDKPQWVGRTTTHQFGKKVTDDLVILDAELKFPASIPFFHKVITDSTYLYGVALSGDRIYKITISDSTVITSAVGLFGGITAICIDTGGLHMWVYDRGTSTYGTIYKVLLSDLSIVLVTTLQFIDLLPGSYISDMLINAGNIILAAYHPDPMSLPPGAEQFLWKTPVPTITGGTPTPTNVTPRLHGTPPPTLQPGEFLDDTRIQELFPLSLVDFPSGYGWALHLHQGFLASDAAVWMKSNFTTQHLYSFVYCLTGNGSQSTPAGVIEFDQRITNIGADGFQYIFGTTLYWGMGRRLYKNSATVNSNAGVYSYIGTGATTSSELTYASAPSFYVPGAPAILYLTRVSGVPGIDTINSAFASFTTLYTGSQITITPTDSSEANVFEENTTYFYRGALQYDGYQQSPLSILTSSKINGSGNTFGSSVEVIINKIDTLSPRVSDILIFRAAGGLSAPDPGGYYRLAVSIPLSDQRWVISETTATITVIDNSLSGSSYEAISGIPETVPDTMVNYALSTQLNGELFVGKCYHPDLPDAAHILFKSKVARFDMIDWTSNFLRLPIVPTAMASFGGRVYVFDETSTYKINPEGMYIEDVYSDAGCFGPQSVLVTGVGVFHCDKSGVYLIDGRNRKRLSDPISFATTSENTVSWTDLQHAQHLPVLGFNPITGYLMINVGNPPDMIFAYLVGADRWDYWTTPEDTFAQITPGFFNAPDGSLYWTGQIGSYLLAGDTSTRHQAVWYSKKITIDDPSQIKKFYKIRGVSSGNLPSIEYSLGEGEVYSAISGSDLVSPTAKAKSIRLRVVFAPSSGSLESLSIILRPLIGKR